MPSSADSLRGVCSNTPVSPHYILAAAHKNRPFVPSRRRVDRDQRSRRRRPAQPGAMILGNSAIDRLGLMQQLISVFKAGRSPCDIAVSIHRTRSQPRPRRRMICSVMPGVPSLPAPILTPALDDELLERPGDQREDRARPLDNLRLRQTGFVSPAAAVGPRPRRLACL